MRIIKKGVKPDWEVCFECPTCGTIFEANESEYGVERYSTDKHFYCNCPICGVTVYAPKGRLRGIISFKQDVRTVDDISKADIVREMLSRG